MIGSFFCRLFSSEVICAKSILISETRCHLEQSGTANNKNICGFFASKTYSRQMNKLDATLSPFNLLLALAYLGEKH